MKTVHFEGKTQEQMIKRKHIHDTDLLQNSKSKPLK